MTKLEQWAMENDEEYGKCSTCKHYGRCYVCSDCDDGSEYEFDEDDYDRQAYDYKTMNAWEFARKYYK